MSRNFKDGFIKAFMDYSKSVGAPKKFLLWSAISGVSCALERKTWIRYNKNYIYPNQFIFLIASSGAGKSTAIRPISKLLKQMKGIVETSTQFSAASLITQMKEAGDLRSFEYLGKAYKNSSMTLITDEASVTIGEKNGLDGVQILLTNLYDCGVIGPWSDLAGWTKNTVGGGSSEIFNPCLNILAGSTPSSFLEVLGKNGVAGGFASRILFVVQEERQARNKGWVEDSEAEDFETQKLLAEDLASINQMKGCFRVDESWKSVFEQYETEFDLKAALGGQMTAYFDRKLQHCIKLAQVLAADQSSSMVLTGEHLESARELIESIESEMYSPFANIGENKNLKTMNFIWNFMRRKKSWAKASISKNSYREASARQLDEILTQLIQMKKIKHQTKDYTSYYEILDNSPLGGQNEPT